MSRIKRLLIVCSAALLALTGAFGLAACGGSDADNYFEWWLPEGEDAIFYSGYNDNPVVQYLLQQEYAGRTIDVNFVVPPAGEADSNINTAISTGEYQEIIDTSSITKTYSVAELYEEGIALDLTEYVEQYMPNYKALIDSNPKLKEQVVYNIDGEEKILSLAIVNESNPYNYEGMVYRRDWIVEYGTNPSTGAKFRATRRTAAIRIRASIFFCFLFMFVLLYEKHPVRRLAFRVLPFY